MQQFVKYLKHLQYFMANMALNMWSISRPLDWFCCCSLFLHWTYKTIWKLAGFLTLAAAHRLQQIAQNLSLKYISYIILFSDRKRIKKSCFPPPILLPNLLFPPESLPVSAFVSSQLLSQKVNGSENTIINLDCNINNYYTIKQASALIFFIIFIMWTTMNSSPS